ncbi:radical SAM protein [Candidatus Sumerlaeota bacterium]|nr:radical SAM protein [Candidatus Sumerlaeota bacterium]
MNPDQYQEYSKTNPHSIWIEPTSRCNARCIHCHHHYKTFGTDMSSEVYHKIRDILLKDVRNVTLTGYGEPLMAEIFEEMFQDCIERKINVRIITNGILLPKGGTLERLAKGGATICLSIDGARAETYEKIRPGIKWEKMLDILNRIKMAVNTHGKADGFALILHFVAMKQNIDDLSDMVNLAHEYGANEVVVLPLQQEYYFEKVKGESLYDSPELVSVAYLRALERSRKYGILLTVPHFFREMIFKGKGGKQPMKTVLSGWTQKARYVLIQLRNKSASALMKKITSVRKPKSGAGVIFCNMPWEASYFEASGTVYPCCAQGEEMGNLKDSPWNEIWNGSLYKNLRRTIHGWNPASLCRYCPLFFGINGGDPNRYDHYFSQFKVKPVPLDSQGVRFQKDFFPLELKEDGSISHLWMAKKGRIVLPMIPNAVFLRLITSPRFPMNKINPGYCRVNGREIQYFDNSCQNIHLPLEDVKEDRIELDIEMEHAFKVGDDLRDLSLVIMGMEYLTNA